MARRGGFRLRPQVCPEWVKAAGLDRLSPAEIDAVSGATQEPGAISLTWDCRTAAGEPVPPGTYVYKVEGNIYYGPARAVDRKHPGRGLGFPTPPPRRNTCPMPPPPGKARSWKT